MNSFTEASTYDFTEAEARELDQSDPLPTRRDQFWIPPHPGRPDEDAAYLAGNSLGLQQRATATDLQMVLDDWARLGVGGHVHARHPWVDFHTQVRAPAARLVGASPSETIAMNSLTVNLHLLMASFYRPTAERHAIVIEDMAFPSDSYAVRSQAAWHGYDPAEAVIRLTPRAGEDCLRTEDVVAFFAEHGHRVALALLGGVNYYTGEYLDIPAITSAARAAGAVAAWDLAHAVGNVELHLHDWDVDWAAWCTYKYLNAGPGAVAGVFVHERHLADQSLERLSGWFSTDPASRFEMRPTLDFVASADAWQVSNPPILALAPVLTSLQLFDSIGMSALRAKSERLTAYLAAALTHQIDPREASIITPSDPARRGSQLSVRLHRASAETAADRMRDVNGVLVDERKPDVIRLAAAPLYVTYHDCWRAATAIVAAAQAVSV